MKTIEKNTILKATSICDSNCVWTAKVIERKGNSKFKLFHQKYTPDFFYECFQDKPYSLEIRSQKIDGYEQSHERFNVFGFSVDFLSRN